MSKFQKDRGENLAGISRNRANFIMIMVTEFSLCSSVTMGLDELDGGKLLFCSVGSSLIPHCRRDDNKNVVISFVCLIINTFSRSVSLS